MKEKVLIVDDDLATIRVLKTSLQIEGYEVLDTNSAIEGLRLAYQHHPELVILDIMMPEMDGIEVCKRLRQMSDVPILMLTAKPDEQAVLDAFNAGADDYVIKPFRPKELIARVAALMKRSSSSKRDDSSYNDGVLKIDLERQAVYREGEEVHLTPTEFRLLDCLVRNQGQVITHDELLKQVWGTAYKSATVLLSVYISYLREKLEDKPGDPMYIRNKWGVGYWFEPRARF